jgi:pentapeptide repeat protein
LTTLFARQSARFDPVLAAVIGRRGSCDVQGEPYRNETSLMLRVLVFAFLLAVVAAFCIATIAPAFAMSEPHANPADVASIRAGRHDCPHCQLAGADLTNTCVKHGNLEGADFEGANAVLMCMSYANFTAVNFRNADLSGANLAHAILDGADFTNAKLAITSFKGTDLTRAKGLTQHQLDEACGDADTKAPTGLSVHACR